MVVRTQFEREYEILENRMLDLKMIVQEELNILEKSLHKNKSSYIQDMGNLSDQAKELSEDCLHQCRQIILLQHPVASDMRKMHSMNNVFFDLERIANMIKEAFELLIPFDEIGEKACLNPSIEIARMMISSSLNHFGTDFKSGKDVSQMDDQADHEYENILAEKIARIQQNPQRADLLVHVLMAAKYMERICDHCVSIARWSAYCLN